MRPVPIYVHIPKTGETTYCTALMRGFHGGKRFSIMGLRNRNDQKIERLFRLTEKQMNRIGPSSTGQRDFFTTVRSPSDHPRNDSKWIQSKRPDHIGSAGTTRTRVNA